MLHSGGVLLLVSLAVGQAINPRALDHPLEDDSSPISSPISFNHTDEEPMGICFFDGMPSALCRLRCFWQDKSVRCDEESRCFCQDWEDEDEDVQSDGGDVTNATEPDVSFTFTETDPNLAGICLFGAFPSAVCKIRCLMRDQSAVCDEESNCWCQELANDEIANESHTEHTTMDHHNSVSDHEDADEDSDESNPGLVLYIIHLFGPEDDVKDAAAAEGVPSVHEGWTIPHILAVLILILFVVLVTVECVLFCVRRRLAAKPGLQTVLSPPQLGSVCANGKQ